MKFEDVYKKPFKRRYTKVFTSEYNMVFDFVHPLLIGMFEGRTALPLSDVEMDLIVDALNNETDIKGLYENVTYEKEQGTISINDSVIILIRGWGYLTGSGGLNLSSDKAFQIQNEFADWIVSKLNSEQNVHGSVATGLNQGINADNQIKQNPFGG